MSHTPSRKYIDDNECSGPRPPVPGEESRVKKMTEGVSECPKNSPPSYLNWARAFGNLLEDRDGVELFMKYVEVEAPAYTSHLKFYFACEGLKQQSDQEEIKKIIKAIYRLLKTIPITISEDLRRTIKAGLKNEIPLSPNIYDALQQSTENTIREKIYPNFLRSDMYFNYIQQMSAAQERCTGAGAGVVTTGKGTAAPGTSSAGGLYGPSTSASSSGSGSATDTLPRSSTLPTLHEDTELTINHDFDNLRMTESRISAEMPMRLTRDLLLATEERRLEIRPPGAHGYVYTATTSYNPNSRVDSERQSCSSGGRTDSDTMSLSNCSMDGRPCIRRPSSSECKAMRQNALATKETNIFQVIPRTQRMDKNEHKPLKTDKLIALLIPKLEEVKRKQDLEERLERLQDESSLPADRLPLATSQVNDRALAEAIREKFAVDDDNDQDILDQHVSRVWKDLTPHRSPGTMSPCPPLPSRRRTTTHDSGMISDGAISIGAQSIRHSKSMPDHSSSSRRLTSKWPSMNTDSGISLLSDTLMKYKDSSSRTGSSTAFQLEEAKRRLEDETRRSRRYSQHPPPLPMQSMSSSSSGSSSIQPPQLSAKPLEATTVVFSFCDEEFPYRTKIPGNLPTLKQFKDYLPKKGNFRFFFKTHCEDPDCPVIQEEIVNDYDILPLFEGKVMGLVKPSD